MTLLPIAAGLLLASAGSALAATRYADANSHDPAPPYSNWATAATNIQDAVDAASAGDEIVVTNGTYAFGGRAVDGSTTNRVTVDKPLILRSIKGPQLTTIDGGGLVRCLYLTNGASLSGFTLTNGVASSGGGVFCESVTVAISNCVVSGNSAISAGSGRFLPVGAFCCDGYPYVQPAFAGGVYGGTLNDCILNNNRAETYTFYGPPCDGSTCKIVSIIGNRFGYRFPGSGGGAANATLNSCTLTGNLGGYGGGAYGCTLSNCTLNGNSAISGDVGHGGGASGCTLNNCTLTGNSAVDGGGAYSCALNNCALTGNYADAVYTSDVDGDIFRHGGYGGGAFGSTLNNCILYFNTAPDGANYDSSSILNYSCTTPQPTNAVGNITNTPIFVDLASGNLRLQSNSPCINAGLNAFAPAGPDLEGHPRIKGGTVDMGAYEFQLPTSIISYAWLQRYTLPTDGSADSTDADGDLMNNWQEWRCGTDPTNTLSSLRLLAPVAGGIKVTVTWQSIAGVNYFLERSTNLAEAQGFAPLATNIPGQAGTTTYTDTKAIGSGPFFYRVGVQ